MDLRKPDVWVLIVDSTRARIVRGFTREGGTPAAELVLKTEAHQLRDIMADKPGRSFGSFGGGRRSAMDYGSDPLKEDDRQFLREVVALLESHRRADEVHHLAIFGEPRALGLLRKILPPPLRRLVIREFALNLLHVSPHDLPLLVLDHLEKAGASGDEDATRRSASDT